MNVLSLKKNVLATQKLIDVARRGGQRKLLDVFERRRAKRTKENIFLKKEMKNF
jgi:hypothetical protein